MNKKNSHGVPFPPNPPNPKLSSHFEQICNATPKTHFSHQIATSQSRHHLQKENINRRKKTTMHHHCWGCSIQTVMNYSKMQIWFARTELNYKTIQANRTELFIGALNRIVKNCGEQLRSSNYNELFLEEV